MKKTRILEIQDRKLGDEWLDWEGRLSSDEQDANTGKRIYLGLFLITVVGTGLGGYLLWYMISPRLAQFHPILPLFFGLLFIAVWGILALWFFAMILSIITVKDFFMVFGRKKVSITFLVPTILKLGTQLGFSRDRLSNSFVKVSNTLIRSRAQKIDPEKLLILLPRCLNKPLLRTITDFSQLRNIPVYIVAGGEKAREIVYSVRPKAIIGVACERDLLSGIQEIIDRIPVIGIPNIRPEGPCKNTLIDIHDFERAVQTFLGSEFNLTTTPPDSHL